MEKTQEAKQESNNKTKPVLKKVSTVFFILLFTAVLACLASVVTTKYIYHKPAALFGYRVVKIITDSMSPQLPVNSYILVKNIDGSKVKEGDIVVYESLYVDSKGRPLPITHLCIQGPYKDEGMQKICILTQGTKEGAPVDDPIPIERVQSVYISSIGKAGGFFDFLTSIWGIMVMVAIPSLVVVILQVIRMVRAVVDAPDEAQVQAEAERIEKEREQALKEEALRSIGAQADGASSGGSVGEFGDVMAYIAREKAKNAPADAEEGQAQNNDEMSGIMAFIAREKAKQNAASDAHKDQDKA